MTVRLLNDEEIALVSGGEVGATHMGDNYHYTGSESPSSWASWIGCIAGSAVACNQVFWNAFNSR